MVKREIGLYIYFLIVSHLVLIFFWIYIYFLVWPLKLFYILLPALFHGRLLNRFHQWAPLSSGFWYSCQWFPGRGFKGRIWVKSGYLTPQFPFCFQEPSPLPPTSQGLGQWRPWKLARGWSTCFSSFSKALALPPCLLCEGFSRSEESPGGGWVLTGQEPPSPGEALFWCPVGRPWKSCLE